jgi:HKD family nuclease
MKRYFNLTGQGCLMKLMNQPFSGQLGSYLIELLDSQDYQVLNIVVAFAKNSGVLRIKDSLKRFRDRGGIVNIYVGVDLDVTSYDALTVLLLHTDSLNVVHAEKGQTFHSKIYQFLGQDKGLVVVGSHNLTAGGLWTNLKAQ